MILVEDEISAIEDIDSENLDVELVCVELRNNKGQKPLVGVVYRANCSGNVGKNIRQEIRDVCVKGTSVIMGDLNLHID